MHVAAPMKTEIRGSNSTSISIRNPSEDLLNNSLTGALRGCLGSLDGACIEKLLLHCACALESNDGTLAQQVMWVLNNVASLVGDPNQRLTAWFLRALIRRSSKVCPMNYSGSSIQRRMMTVTELAGYVDLIPWHRFGFCASNSVILKVIEGYSKVHILDFSITYCMQWPTLIDALAKRPQGAPSLKITVPSSRPDVPPLLNVSSKEVGQRLCNFAKFRDVPLEFNVIDDRSSPNSCENMQFKSLLDHLSTHPTLNISHDEALVINVQNWIRFLSDEQTGINTQDCSLRDAFLREIKGLDPCIVLIVDEDSELCESSLTTRITTCFNYLWIPFDSLETFLPRDSCQRLDYESDIGHKIENIISCEGVQRIERLESGVQLSQRMKKAGFVSIPFLEDTTGEVKSLLDEHAGGWRMKKEEDMLVLTWKGHNSVFATAWVTTNEN